MVNPAFESYIGIDYSGAQTPKSSIKGLRVYEADRLTAAQEVVPPPSPRKYWTRKGVAEWLVERLSEGSLTLVGIDHGFSFPFPQHDKFSLKSSTQTLPNIRTNLSIGCRTYELVLSARYRSL
jgi:hypothetical protein